MKDKDIFKKYYSRLAREGILKSALFGIILGCGLSFVVAVISWLVARYYAGWFPIGLGLAIGVGAITGVGSAVLSYYKIFRSTTKKIARRIDRLGLEERLITMAELEKDESYIAVRQREDAQNKLKRVSPRDIRFSVHRAVLVAACIVGALGLAMTSVNTLTAVGVIPEPSEIFPVPRNPEDFFTVIYEAEGGGHIEGERIQTVYKGEDGTAVIAVADEGYVFVGWDDDYNDVERCAYNIRESKLIVALFEAFEEPDDPNDEEDDPSAQPPDEDEAQTPQETPEDPDDSNPNESEDDRYDAGNQIIDGKTPYQDVFPDYYEEAKKELAENKNLTPEQRAAIEAYLEYLRASAGKNEES